MPAENLKLRRGDMEITIVYFEGCPHAELAERHVRAAVDEGAEVAIRMRMVDNAEQADAAGMHGSPTILVDGRDPFSRPDEPTSWACRLFETPDGFDGAPTTDQLRELLKP